MVKISQNGILLDWAGIFNKNGESIVLPFVCVYNCTLIESRLHADILLNFAMILHMCTITFLFLQIALNCQREVNY